MDARIRRRVDFPHMRKTNTARTILGAPHAEAAQSSFVLQRRLSELGATHKPITEEAVALVPSFVLPSLLSNSPEDGTLGIPVSSLPVDYGVWLCVHMERCIYSHHTLP